MKSSFYYIIRKLKIRLRARRISYIRVIREMLDRWKLDGEHYGYPSCCIDAFIERRKANIDWKYKGYNEPKFYIGTGFVPCLSCSLKDPKELIQHIKSHRKERLEFPKTNLDEKCSCFKQNQGLKKP